MPGVAPPSKSYLLTIDTDSSSSDDDLPRGTPSFQINNDKRPTIPSIIQNRIIEKVKNNRLTIIVGATGCGKSTLVPQLLLDTLGGPVLCTQPRRLAVVAVSTHVAQQRGVALGQEVGYHVGQNRVANNTQTKLLFATAGILLEELRSDAKSVVTKYKVIVIDECHERSSESDLCLAILKSVLTKHANLRVRIILMSATFNHGRYYNYFRSVPGCEIIDTITLETGNSISAFHSNVKTFYLEDIMPMIPSHVRPSLFSDFERQMRLNPNEELLGNDKGKSLSYKMIELIMFLIGKLHREERGDAVFLVFAPTYRHLEQIYDELSDFDTDDEYTINVLHSSIDIEDCLRSMHIDDDNNSNDSKSQRNRENPKRQILLASAIADSSVTIPGVTCVIDTCRALEVRWDNAAEKYNAKTVWASKSICDQRRGRTGRTCPGRVFRLLNQSFYINNLEEWDQPQIELASCRDEVLALLSSTDKILSDPQAVLQRCLDPPPKQSISKAIEHLTKIGACILEQNSKKPKLVPTELGKLLAALPFTVSESMIVVNGARRGLLHEALVLVSIMSTRPHPIIHKFGESAFNEDILKTFYSEANSKDKKSVILANFCAYIFWSVNWERMRANICNRRFMRCTASEHNSTEYFDFEGKYGFDFPEQDLLFPTVITTSDQSAYDCNVWDWSPKINEAHINWCTNNFINPTSVRAIAECIEVARKILFHSDYEPIWLRCQELEPRWNRQGLKLFLHSDSNENRQCFFEQIYVEKQETICRILEKSYIILRLRDLQDSSSSSLKAGSSPITSTSISSPLACIYFLKGNCTFGDSCKNSHSLTAIRPPCRFSTGCSNPRCLYSHDPDNKATLCLQAKANTDTDIDTTMIPAKYGYFQGGVLTWYKNASSSLMLLGEGDCSFTKSMWTKLGCPPSLCTVKESILTSVYCHETGVDATRCHINEKLNKIQRQINHVAWNFPFTGEDENDPIHESLLSGTFMSVARFFDIRKLSNLENYNPGVECEFGIALQGDQFSRWSVQRSARRANFDLEWWDEFDYSNFPGYHPKRSNAETFPVQKARFYLFKLRNGFLVD